MSTFAKVPTYALDFALVRKGSGLFYVLFYRGILGSPQGVEPNLRKLEILSFFIGVYHAIIVVHSPNFLIGIHDYIGFPNL